jgi:hypothetical protein
MSGSPSAWHFPRVTVADDFPDDIKRIAGYKIFVTVP